MVDLGVDVPADKFVEAVKENNNVVLVACSGLLTTTMPALKKPSKPLKQLIGYEGHCWWGSVTPEYATEIGADGYAPDTHWCCCQSQRTDWRLSRYKNTGNNYPK